MIKINSIGSIFLFFLAAGIYCQDSRGVVESETNLMAPQDSKDAVDVNLDKPDPNPIAPPSGREPLTLLRLGESDAFSPYGFLVDKSTRTLSVWRFQSNIPQLVAYYPSDMGREPGNKQFLGDLKTPEGIYFFQNRYDSKQLNFNEYGSLAFTTDYPNFFDILDAKTGSGIWLHAIPENKSLLRGSRGCVVVRNEVIQKVSDFIMLRQTPFVIEERVQYVTPEERASNMIQLNAWLDGWRKSWENKDIDAYISHYGNEFKSLGMNRSSWKQYKENLNSRYQSIQVRTTDPVMVIHSNEAVIKFMQTYQSDKKADFGEKTLYLKKDEQGQFRIVGEEWTESTKKITASQLSGTNDSL